MNNPFSESKNMSNVSFAYFCYFIFYSLTWAWTFYFGTTILPSLLTAMFTVMYLSYRTLTFNGKNIHIAMVLLMVCWLYQCLLMIIGEYNLGGFSNIWKLIANILVPISILLVVLDEKFYASVDKYSMVVVFMSLGMLAIPIFINIHFGVASSLRMTGMLIGRDVNYQHYGDICVILFCFAFAYIKSVWNKFIFSVYAVYSLLVLGSKAGAVGLFLTLVLVGILWLIKGKRFGALICIILMLPMIYYAGVISKDKVYANLPIGYEWTADLIYKNIDESSLKSRAIIKKANSGKRIYRVILGEYDYERNSGLGEGYYTHNVADYMDRYGILYFFVICCLYIYIYWKNIMQYFCSKNLLNSLALCVMTYWGILSIFVRSSGSRYEFLPLGIGVFVVTNIQSQMNEVTERSILCINE